MAPSFNPGAALVPVALLLFAQTGGPAMAQQQGYGQTVGGSQQQQDANFGGGPSRNTSIFNTANPIDLMNVIRRGTAMDDATPPGDAIDAALSDYQTKSPGSTAVKPAP
jgi:hypothetical protein